MNITLTTPRLILRPFCEKDIPAAYRNWCSDPEVTRYLRWEAHHQVEKAERMLQQWLSRYASGETYYWGITLKDGEMIGSIGVDITSAFDLQGSLGYKIGSRWWHQGYAKEAAKAVIDYMFRFTDLERLDAYHAVENAASGRVMAAAGMRYEGLLRSYYRTRAGFHDCALYAIPPTR